MAEVMQVPRDPDGQSYYQSSGLQRSRPSSSSLFLAGTPPVSSSPLSSSPKPPSFSPPRSEHTDHQERISNSPPSSSVSSSPLQSAADFSNFPSYSSTPLSSGVSLEDKYSDQQDFDFPHFEQFGNNADLNEPPPSPKEEESSEEPEESTTTDTTRSDSPLATPTVADDTAIKTEPSQHVDYLSHDWREEDIWSSWRHIVSQRKVYGQRSRLENASWRTWAKSKYHLRTVSPETLNWLKESDVTWLYGPLKAAESHPITSHASDAASQLSKNSSFVNKKPILKKRSVSEVMLQKSISASNLVKQAAASVQAQGGNNNESRRSILERTNSEFLPSGLNSETPSRDPPDYFSEKSSSTGDETPSCEKCKRHIRFDDKVEQCIAVEMKEGDNDEPESSEDEEEEPRRSLSSDSSDEGLVMMKRKRRPGLTKRSKAEGGGSRSGSHNGRKTIETLPSTTLKYRTDTPDPPEAAQQPQPFGRSWSNSRVLSPSPSQETLRPSHPSSNFLLPDDDEDEDDTASSTWSFGASNPKSSLGASASPIDSPSNSRNSSLNRRDNKQRARSYGMGEEDMEGMRRTNSGMFMPYEEDEDDVMAAGLFGRVSETINTAKDIAHVIWNVGWRK